MVGKVLDQFEAKAEGQGVRRIVVIGAGIAGLSAGYYLKKGLRDVPDVELLILERFVRAGGVISTYQLDEYVLELGPDAFLTEKPDALDFCKELGLEDRIVGTNPECRTSFIAYNNKLHPLPEGFAMLAPTQLLPFLTSPLFSWAGKIRMAMDLFIPKGPIGTDESLSQFVRRRLGQEALDRVAQPMLGGVYTADPELLSLRATMPRFLEMEEKFGSVIRGLAAGRKKSSAGRQTDSGARYSMFASLRRGLSEMVDRAVELIGEEHVRYQCPVVGVDKGTNGKAYDVVLARGTVLPCDGVILASPAFISGDILSGLDPDLSHSLKKIQYASSAVLNLIFNRNEIPHPLNGFGFVVPITEKRHTLACSFSSVKFQNRCPPERVILRAFVGGALQQDVFDLADEQIECLIWEDLHTYLGLESVPLLSLITRYNKAMPQYHVGHLDLINQIEQRLSAYPGLQLAGNAYRGIGIPDCIRSGRQAAEQILKTITLLV